MPPLRLDMSNGIATLTFNRPRKKNAINQGVVEALGVHLSTLESAHNLRAVILHGEGQTFVSGGDLNALHGAEDDLVHSAIHRPMAIALSRLESLPVPVLCAIEGYAIGGGMEIAMACDLRIAATDACLSFRQIHLGLSPGWGATRRLHQLLGKAQTLKILWEGKDLSGASAYELGLVEVLCPSGGALTFAKNMAQSLARSSAPAIAGIKTLVGALNRQESTFIQSNSYREMEILETSVFETLWATPEHKNAVESLVNKQKDQKKRT